MSERRDVVVVGAGIAGGALATVLARSGLDVLVLERQTTYRDRVRGEWMAPWGAAEAIRLGLDDVFLGAGGGYGTRIVNYDETFTPEDAEARAIPLDSVLPGVPGSLNVGHPQACEALTQAALQAGATVVRGVGDVVVTGGSSPEVAYELGSIEHRVRCRLVVGADGRSSSVRSQVGIALHETTPRLMGAGLLVEGLREWPHQLEAMGTEGDIHYLIFARPSGLARLYLMWDIAQKGRFTGASRDAEFLAAFRLSCLPGSEEFVAAQPAGPCASYPMNDTWADEPFADGVVLIGDAAGWNDPLIGQGLSIAVRDVRVVSDALLASADWTPTTFAPYAAERLSSPASQKQAKRRFWRVRVERRVRLCHCPISGETRTWFCR